MINAISDYYQKFIILEFFFKKSSIFYLIKPSTKPTEKFQIRVYTKNYYIMYSLKTKVNYTDTSGIFVDTIISPKNKAINLNKSIYYFFPVDSILIG